MTRRESLQNFTLFQSRTLLETECDVKIDSRRKCVFGHWILPWNLGRTAGWLAVPYEFLRKSLQKTRNPHKMRFIFFEVIGISIVTPKFCALSIPHT